MGNETIISPTVMIDLVGRIENTLWDKYKTYRDVLRYVTRWQEEDGDYNDTWYNFEIIKKNDNEKIDLSATLDAMGDELLFQIAVDLGIEVPGLIYAVPEIKGILSSKYEDVGRTFNKAFEKVYSEPAISIQMASSALERIIKKICKDPRIKGCNSKDTLYKLTEHILKEFKYFPDNKLDKNIRNIGSGLIKVTQAIEAIRSNNTEVHGTEDEIINDPIYAMFVINAVSTAGLFLLNFYLGHYPEENNSLDDKIPF